MDKKQYVVERDYLGKTSVKDCLIRIIKKHSENKEFRGEDCEKTVEKPLDL